MGDRPGAVGDPKPPPLVAFSAGCAVVAALTEDTGHKPLALAMGIRPD